MHPSPAPISLSWNFPNSRIWWFGCHFIACSSGPFDLDIAVPPPFFCSGTSRDFSAVVSRRVGQYTTSKWNVREARGTAAILSDAALQPAHRQWNCAEKECNVSFHAGVNLIWRSVFVCYFWCRQNMHLNPLNPIIYLFATFLRTHSPVYMIAGLVNMFSRFSGHSSSQAWETFSPPFSKASSARRRCGYWWLVWTLLVKPQFYTSWS